MQDGREDVRVTVTKWGRCSPHDRASRAEWASKQASSCAAVGLIRPQAELKARQHVIDGALARAGPATLANRMDAPMSKTAAPTNVNPRRLFTSASSHDRSIVIVSRKGAHGEAFRRRRCSCWGETDVTRPRR